MRPQIRPFARASARPTRLAALHGQIRAQRASYLPKTSSYELTHVRRDARADRGIKGCEGRGTPGFGARDAEI
eukprot:6978775-Prymnesium_polylepis.1